MEQAEISEKSDKWQSLQEKINAAIEEWRREHPEATLTEIEEAVDTRLASMRRQMVQDLAQAGRTANLRKLDKEETQVSPMWSAGGRQWQREAEDQDSL